MLANNSSADNRSTEVEYMNITYHTSVLKNVSRSENELLLSFGKACGCQVLPLSERPFNFSPGYRAIVMKRISFEKLSLCLMNRNSNVG